MDNSGNSKMGMPEPVKTIDGETYLHWRTVKILKNGLEQINGKAELAVKILEPERANIASAFRLLQITALQAVEDFDAARIADPNAGPAD